jgi:hypothetical protein
MQDSTTTNRAESVDVVLMNREEAVYDMLKSAAPEDIQSLAEYAEDFNPFGFSVAELDEIADGKNTAVHLENVKSRVFLLDILRSIDWWVGISTCPPHGRSVRGIDGDPAFEEQWEQLLHLLNDVFASYTPALDAMQRYSRSGVAASAAADIELLRRYRIYTRAVCDFARDVWPHVDLGWLYQRP